MKKIILILKKLFEEPENPNVEIARERARRRDEAYSRALALINEYGQSHDSALIPQIDEALEHYRRVA